MCLFARMPYFPEIDKTQKSGLLSLVLEFFATINARNTKEIRSYFVTMFS